MIVRQMSDFPDRVRARLVQQIKDIFTCRGIDRLMNNLEYEELDYFVPLQHPGAPLNILANEQGANRSFLSLDTFEYLPTVVFPTIAGCERSNNGSGCGAGGTSGAHCVNGSPGGGSTGSA